MVSVTMVVLSGLTATLIVLIVSHPTVVVATVSMIVPAAVNVCPRNVYGN